MKDALRFYEAELAAIREAGTYKDERIITTPQRSRIDTTKADGVLNLCANNYLGLADSAELIAAAKEAADFPSCVDPDDNRFLAPESMIEEVKAACADTQQQVPATTGEVMQCVYNSLTQDYRRAVGKLQTLTGKTYTSLNIVGGGSQDAYLNQQTANATGLPVFAGPTEGTALGNLMVQFIHNGDFADLAEARAAIKKSFTIAEYQPQ